MYFFLINIRMEFFNALWNLGKTSQPQECKTSNMAAKSSVEELISGGSRKEQAKMNNRLPSQKFKNIQP